MKTVLEDCIHRRRCRRRPLLRPRPSRSISVIAIYLVITLISEHLAGASRFRERVASRTAREEGKERERGRKKEREIVGKVERRNERG